MLLLTIQPTPPPGDRLATNLSAITQRQERIVADATPTNPITPTTNKPAQQNPLHRFISFVNNIVSDISREQRTLFQITLANRNQLSSEQQKNGIPNIRGVLQNPTFAYLAQIPAFMTEGFREQLESKLSKFLNRDGNRTTT